MVFIIRYIVAIVWLLCYIATVRCGIDFDNSVAFSSSFESIGLLRKKTKHSESPKVWIYILFSLYWLY